jgi:hypothetical protein
MLHVSLLALLLSQTIDPGSAGISGQLRDRASRRPLAGASVNVLGTTVSLRTDTSGQFKGGGLRPGLYLLQVRALGYDPASWMIELAARETLFVQIEMESILTLAPVAVEAAPWQLRGMVGFNERRVYARGVYLDEREIEQTHATRLSDILRSIPGVRLVCRYNGCRMRMSRSECQPDFFVDGHAANNSTSLEMPLIGVIGIEIYRTITETPVDFLRGANTCGTIVIWTRSGP